MIVIKSEKDIKNMELACRISAQALKLAGESIKPGMTTKELNTIIHNFIVKNGAAPSFLDYNGFSGSACISINEEVIHGIPGKRIIKDGDVVSVDVGAYINGFHGDNASTFAVGNVDENILKLLEITEKSLYEGIKKAVVGNRVGDISNAIETYILGQGDYGIVREYTGHGVGKKLHEDPQVPNFGPVGRGARLTPGMTIAIEPMINLKGDGIRHLSDDWTVITKSKLPSAHFEHTILITESEPIILTKP